MNSKSSQTSILVATLSILLLIGGIAAYKIFSDREKDDLNRSLLVEAEALEGKIKSYFQDLEICTLNLAGKSKVSFIDQIVLKENGEIKPIYTVNKVVGRLKIDMMKLDLVSEEKSDSQIKLIYSISNFSDEHSRKILGVKEFKHEVKMLVDDCPTELVQSPDEASLTSRCESLPPDGLGGRALKVVSIGDTATDVPFIMECKVCRNRNRDTIQKCIKDD